jgi:hypothetical protein
MPFINVGNTMRAGHMRRLAVPLLALIVAVLLTITLAPGPGRRGRGQQRTRLVGRVRRHEDAGGTRDVHRRRERELHGQVRPGAYAHRQPAQGRLEHDDGRGHLAAGGTSGWHTHPGPVIVNVTEGQVIVTNANDCRPRTYGPGQAFVDPGQGNVHIASNASGTDQAKAVATFFGVPAGSPATIMAPPAAC